jgi:predicted RND superfamily exporter protein
MSNSNGEINVGAKENISGTILWLQIGAYAGFASAALSLIGVVRGAGASGIVGIAIGVYLAFLLLQQSQKLKEYTESDNMKAYEESLVHENSYWLTMMILMIIAVVVIVLGIVLVTVVASNR